MHTAIKYEIFDRYLKIMKNRNDKIKWINFYDYFIF